MKDSGLQVPAPPPGPWAGAHVVQPEGAELLRLEVGPVAAGGSCVARHEGRVVFVRHALPGELVLARLTAPARAEEGAGLRYWRADAVQVLRASPDRVEPPCPSSGPGRCGGCDWQHASIAGQRAGKAELVREHLRRLAGVDRPDLVVEPPGEAGHGADDGLGWRTRMRFAVDSGGRAGLRVHRSHTVVPLPGCPITHPDVAAVDVTGRSWPGTAAVEVALGSAPPPLVVVEPVDGPRRGSSATGAHHVPPMPVEVCLARRGPGGLTRLRGRTWVEHRVRLDGDELRFRVSEGGFWQGHPAAAQTLLDAVLAAADPRPGELAMDLYCGAGLFAAGLAARVGPDGAVLAVERDRRAATDARRNLHDRPWVHLVQGRVERALAPRLAEPPFSGHADLVVLDPSRSGAGAAVMSAVCAAGPRAVVYVACDPAAMARDVAMAAGRGYRLDALRAFDLFPMTHHVECVATLVPTP